MRYLIRSLIGAGATSLGLLAACSAGSQDLTEAFSGEPEVERLRYFKEIDADKALSQRKLTGRGVRVTVMGEMVDATHPELIQAVNKQFNAFARYDAILPGTGNAAYKAELFGKGDGHGTHIAGTIAAACDGVGIQGVACGSTLDVYDLGAYDGADRFREMKASNVETDEIFDFLMAFRNAIQDVTRRGESKITTGSFNIEAPAISFPNKSYLSRADLATAAEEINDTSQAVLNSSLFGGVSDTDKSIVQRSVEANDDDFLIAVLALTPALDEFHKLADAFGAYQKSGGVYIVTESNYAFGNNTSALNAMPSLSGAVDPDLWLSVVMVQPDGIDRIASEVELDAALAGRYSAPLNGCGTLARDYCIVTPSYHVLSSMTDRVAERGEPIYQLDGRSYQAYSGHSMGAPMVAAALALMQEFNDTRRLGLTMRQMVRILKDTADRRFKGYDPIRHGRGMLNVDAAISAMANL